MERPQSATSCTCHQALPFRKSMMGRTTSRELGRDLFGRARKGSRRQRRPVQHARVPPGTKWHYASVETEILGLVLRSATGEPVADYLHDRIWDAIGAEADATWAIDGTGQEIAFCCFNATLRDYARLGRLLAHDGAWEGRQLIPRQWVLDATTVKPADGYLAPGTANPYFGYGYQVWLFPASSGDLRCSESGVRSSWSIQPPSSSWCTPPFARNRRTRPLMPSRLRCGSPCSRSLDDDCPTCPDVLMPRRSLRPARFTLSTAVTARAGNFTR